MTFVLTGISSAIADEALPSNFDDLFREVWDPAVNQFNTQENEVLDFKETIPTEFSNPYGTGIVRLVLGFHNTFGGIIVFGVEDTNLKIVGTDSPFDIEKLNRSLTDIAGIHIECLAKSYLITTEGELRTIQTVLVPKRGIEPPAKLRTEFAKYRIGTTWIRERHEVLEAEVRHLPILYSERPYPADITQDVDRLVHRSLPPSPATLKDFINRGTILDTLWNWFVLGDQPRIYLHGTGGSGKSTIAFEFARTLAEFGAAVRAKDDDVLDYVLYISGKESELNPQTGKEEPFLFREFSTAKEQYAQILVHSGLLSEDEISKSEGEIDLLLDELFSHFSGLIVIDDIDALTRRKVDTGEETLLIKAIQAPKRTRILYTLRHPPSHAVKSAIPIPGLEPTIELPAFMEACCNQFSVAPPSTAEMAALSDTTSRLPLLVETVVLLRRDTGSYKDAIDTFRQRGGDEARRYLYQREYDRLDVKGRARTLLAGLFLIAEPVSFSTLAGLFQFSKDELREAISDASAIFLSTQENEGGDTLYQLTPPSIPFIERVSKELKWFHPLEVKIQHFRTEGRKTDPRDAALIVSMRSQIRLKQYDKVVAAGEALPSNDLALENPKIRALMGQAYAQLGNAYRERARECFRHAEGLGYKDIFMMRAWYFVEFTSGYGFTEAERICSRVIEDPRMGPRYKSEFWSKLASSKFHRALNLVGASREKALELLRESVCAYFEAIWIGRPLKDFDVTNTFVWAETPLQRLLVIAGSEIEEYFYLFEKLLETGHDIDQEAAKLPLEYLTRSGLPSDVATKQKVKNLCDRIIGKTKKSIKPLNDFPGWMTIIQALEEFSKALGK